MDEVDSVLRKIILLVFAFLLLPPSCFAEIYQNTEYDFQMEIPDVWVDVPENAGKNIICKKNVQHENTLKEQRAIIIFNITPGGGGSYIYDTVDSLTPEQQEGILTAMFEGITHKHSAKLTYSGCEQFGVRSFLIVKADVDMQGYPCKMIYVTTIFQHVLYYWIFNASDNGSYDRVYEDQFFDMLKTFKPIN